MPVVTPTRHPDYVALVRRVRRKVYTCRLLYDGYKARREPDTVNAGAGGAAGLSGDFRETPTPGVTGAWPAAGAAGLTTVWASPY